MVRKNIKENILDFKAINERVCLLRIKTKFFNLTIINAHAETEDKENPIKDSFYLKLEQIYNTAPSNDIKIVIDDLNAKIGKEPAYREITGIHSLHTNSNDNGARVIDFAGTRNMVVASTRFPRKDIHKWTWTSPNSEHHNTNRSYTSGQKGSLKHHERQKLQRGKLRVRSLPDMHLI